MSVMRLELIMKSIVPVVLAGIIANSLNVHITLYGNFPQPGAA
jgi:hypothetical protein